MEVSQAPALMSARKWFLLASMTVSLGSMIAITAGFWDVMNHVLNRPESFFSPPHAMLYSGVAIALAGSVMAFVFWRGLDPSARAAWRLPFRLGIVGIFILVGAGPADFAWHSNFGLDGLLSPPHQVLLAGMLLCAVAPAVVILRYGMDHVRSRGALTGMVIFSLLPVWMSATGFLYSYTLPFSNTDFFTYNPDIWFAVAFATVSMPFLYAIVLTLASRLVRYRFGAVSGLGFMLLAINAASVIASNPALVETIPFYFLTMIPFVAADIMMATYRNRTGIAAAGAIIGSAFYFAYFPFVTYVYNEVIFTRAISGSVTFQVFFEQLPVVLPAVIGPAVIMGILGAILGGRLEALIVGHRAR